MIVRTFAETGCSLELANGPETEGAGIELVAAQSSVPVMTDGKTQGVSSNGRNNMAGAISGLKQGLGVGQLDLHRVIAQGGFGTIFQGVHFLVNIQHKKSSTPAQLSMERDRNGGSV